MRNNKGQFIKGHKGYDYWKGKHLTPDTKQKLSDKLMGRKLSEETRDKMSIARKGKPQEWNRGRKHTLEWRLEMSKRRKGENHWNWQGGKNLESDRIRRSLEYKLWRKAVLERDNYTCRMCGSKNETMQSDHRRPMALFKDLKFVLENGRTLCKICHRAKSKYDVKFINGKLPIELLMMATSDII